MMDTTHDQKRRNRTGQGSRIATAIQLIMMCMLSD